MSELNILRNLSAEVEQLRKLEKEKENYELEVSKLKEEIDSLTVKIRELEAVNSSSSQEIAALQKEVEMVRGARTFVFLLHVVYPMLRFAVTYIIYAV